MYGAASFVIETGKGSDYDSDLSRVSFGIYCAG